MFLQAAKNGAVIIDVRTPKEYLQGHVSQAINIPVDEIVKSTQRVPKNKTLIIYCHSGSRSAHATKILRNQGWSVIDVATQREFEREVKQPN